ncbi:hypothetical protein COO55_10110 [Rhodococcus opacus]|uniref:hypothetical protein n=1 Tax=Rhodococcus sp. A14 TaxID=1194106 RepID=UPI000EDB1758|nr:hypothetical protein COO55_10110 [Rhodococcus opacus]
MAERFPQNGFGVVGEGTGDHGQRLNQTRPLLLPARTGPAIQDYVRQFAARRQPTPPHQPRADNPHQRSHQGVSSHAGHSF